MPDTIPPPPGEDSADDIDVAFEEWALASARLLRRTVIERAQVLSECEFTASWQSIDEHWYEALVQDIDSGRLERLDRFMEICADEMARREEQEEEVKSPLDAIGGPLAPFSGLEVSPRSTIPQQETVSEEGTHSDGAAGEPLNSVTPPLGSSNASLEIDGVDIDFEDEDEEDDDDEISPDDTRVSAAIPELVEKS